MDVPPVQTMLVPRRTPFTAVLENVKRAAPRTRKSVSGRALMLGNSTISTYCKGQAVIAQLRRSGVLWVGECSIADSWLAECSPGLGMEVQCLRNTFDAATMLNCMSGLGLKFQSGEQADFESLSSELETQ